MFAIVYQGIVRVYHLARTGHIHPLSRRGAFWFGSDSASRRSSKRKKRSGRRVRSSSARRKKGRRYTPHTAGKRRDTSRRRIRYTKNGQPYVIMASGKARFISMKSAKSSHKRKGGRY